MLNVLDPGDTLRFSIGQLRAVIKKAWQMPDVDIAVFIKGCREHSTAVLPEVLLHIRPAAKKGHAERCLGNNHNVSSM